MKRFPNGVDGDFFHQKRVPAKHPDYVDEVPVSFPSGHSTVFAVVDNAAALAWVANLGCIELHTWHSRVPEIELPDYLLIDLDPTHRRAVAVRARDRARRARGDGRARARLLPEDVGRDRAAHPGADQAGAAVPRGAPVREGARRGGRAPDRRPGVATTTWRVADRVGVFVDFGQNARDRTIACAYSIRPIADARVSAPLRWDEVADVDPAAFTVETMRERIAEVGDPMRGMWRRAVSLAPRFEQLGLGPTPKSDSTPRRRRSRGGRSSRQVQSSGSLSSRQRINFVPWRKRLPCTLS